MLWFFISKRAPKWLSYTVLVAAWTVGEWLYNTSQASFPWLSIGNGFAHDVWAIQWYEFTGEFGGTVWVLITSILIYECLILRRPRKWLLPALAILAPLAASLAIYFTYDEPTRTAKVTIVQPNIPAWEEDSIADEDKAANLAELTAEAPADAQFIVMPETTIGELLYEGHLALSPSLATLRSTTAEHSPEATIVVGAMTQKSYGTTRATETASGSDEQGWYDYFNAALAIDPAGKVDIHHKAKMVTGAEMMPTWWWVKGLLSLVENLGFYAGQYGFGTERTVFANGGVKAGAEICWESVYGEYTSEFARNGSEVLFIITNDGWWRNTLGHRQHFDLARLRAIETRRAVARSANTGRSGFITSRGDVRETLEWEERGTLTADVALNDRMTLFTRLGDWPARVSLLLLGLSVLYFIAYRIRRKDNIVKS
jgi:apolipoprotein N-acyltransferase